MTVIGSPSTISTVRGTCSWPASCVALSSKRKAETGQPGAQQVNYFLGMPGDLLQRMDDQSAAYGISLPENRRYLGLVERSPGLRILQTGLLAGDGRTQPSITGEHPTGRLNDPPTGPPARVQRSCVAGAARACHPNGHSPARGGGRRLLQTFQPRTAHPRARRSYRRVPSSPGPRNEHRPVIVVRAAAGLRAWTFGETTHP